MTRQARKVLSQMKPNGWQDIAVRTVKTGVVAFVALLLKDGLGHANWATLQAAGDAAWIAGGTVLLNALLQWGNSGK